MGAWKAEEEGGRLMSEERQRILEEKTVGVEIRARDLFAGHGYEKFVRVQRFCRGDQEARRERQVPRSIFVRGLGFSSTLFLGCKWLMVSVSFSLYLISQP
jgi:hypothetical protein